MSLAQSFADVLTARGLNHSGVEQMGEKEVVEFGMTTETTKVRVVSFFDGNTLATRIFAFSKVPENKFGDALLACNALNDEYRFVKFYIDSDNEVVIAADDFLDEDSAGEEAMKVAITTVRIADEAYPKLQRAIWA